MWSIWNAPSDRDYYDPMGIWERWEAEEADRCVDCGAAWDQACAEDCLTRQLINEEDLNEISEMSGVPREG